MQINHLFHSAIAFTVLLISACDDVDENQSRSLMSDEEVGDENEGDIEATRETKTRPNSSENALNLDVVNASKPAAGPEGQYCCAQCGGDDSHYWWNLGTADNCNSRATEFCEYNYNSLINAEWGYC